MKRSKKILLWLMLLLMVSLCACGKQTDEEKENPFGEYVYVPEFRTVDFENANLYRTIMKGEDIYFTQYSYDEITEEYGNVLIRWNVNEPTTDAEKIPLSLDIEGKQTDLTMMAFDEKGNTYCMFMVYPTYDENYDYENYTQEYYLSKYDSNNTLVFSKDISKEMNRDQENNYPQDMLVDQTGRIYIQGNNLVRVFDSECNMIAEIPSGGDWISGMGMSKEGKVLIGQYNYGATSYGYELLELDVENNQIGTVHKEGIPDADMIIPGIESGILLAGDNALYSYDLNTKTTEKILDWTDSNINGSSVEKMQVLSDGRIMVLTQDYSSSENQTELVLLTKTKSSEIADKEIITVATLYDNYELMQYVVAFNKANPQYMVRVNTYIDNNVEWTETTYSDAITRLNNDLTSKNAPDIVELSYTNKLSNYVSKGLLEDLTPYLESSENLSKEAFLEPLLDYYTYDGKLVALARQFNIRTLYGKEKFFGEQDGFTIEELFEYVKENPDKQLFQDNSKMGMFNRLVSLCFDQFVDYSNATCNFNNEKFRTILELSNEQKQMDYQYDQNSSLPELLQTDAVLLNEVYISDMYSYKMYTAMFEEPAVLVGYPTEDGSKGVVIESYNPYGIIAGSKHKDAAWKFMETMYQYTPDENKGYYQFSSLKAEMEDMYTEAMEKEYYYDYITGENEVDENGNMIERPKTSWGYDNWNIDIYAATQEEVDEVKALIENAVSYASQVDEKVSEIVLEEVQPYFKGSKSAEEVMDIIQRRVSLYLSENY